MKKNIHPEYHTQVTATCSCGAEFTVGSTEKTLQTEICSQCHPFYTGKQKVVDSTGRVDRFKKLYKRSQKRQTEQEKIAQAKATREKKKQDEETKDSSTK